MDSDSRQVKKEQTEKLSIQQQEALAEIELRLVQKRQRLLHRANRYRGFIFAPVGFGLTIFYAYTAFITEQSQGLPWLCIIALFALTQYHAIGINQRLDALLELLAIDSKLDPNPSAKNRQK